MLGANKGLIRTKGALNAKFLEYATVKAEGDVICDSLMNCDITTNGMVFLEGRRASIVGGVVRAARGVEAYNIGNSYGVKTKIYAGINLEVKRQLTYHEDSVREAQDMIDKINIGLQQLDEAAKANGTDSRKDPRKASLLRTKIIKQADLVAHTQQLNYMTDIIKNAHGATVKVLRDVHGGVTIGINDSVVNLKDYQRSVAFHEREGKIVMFSMKDEIL